MKVLFCEATILYPFLLQPDVELTVHISNKKLNSKGVCFLFEFF